MKKEPIVAFLQNQVPNLEEYAADPEGFSQNYSRQDAAILNIQRACEAVLDM